MPATVTDPNIQFLIPAGGSTTVSTHNKTNFVNGYAKVFSNGNVTVDSRYMHSALAPSTTSATTVTSRSVSIPVSVGPGITANSGIALLANAAGTLTLSLTNSSGGAIAGGSRSIDVTAGQQITAFVSELLPTVTATQYTGTLTITTSSGTISVLALQFDGTVTALTVTALP
jgi:hypothetical protein